LGTTYSRAQSIKQLFFSYLAEGLPGIGLALSSQVGRASGHFFSEKYVVLLLVNAVVSTNLRVTYHCNARFFLEMLSIFQTFPPIAR
jgi:hypothetical protein